MGTFLTARRRARHSAAAALCVAVVASLPLTVGSVHAAAGDAQALLGDKTVNKATAAPGDSLQYAINYSCRNNHGGPTPDGCDGAVFSDPLPKFTDIFGNPAPVEFVSATGPAAIWPSGFSLDTSDPANPTVVGTAGSWPAGSSGTIFVNVKVPKNTVPVASQDIANTATVTDPEAGADSSTTATTTIAGTAPTWSISKIAPSTTRLNRNVTWNVSVCGPVTSALFPLYTITDTLPPGASFVSASASGVYADDNIAPAGADSTSDGAGTVTWTFDASNRPPLGADGCFRMTIVGQFASGYVDPNPVNSANDDNIGGAVKQNSVTGFGQYTPSGPTTGVGTATASTTINNPTFAWGTGTTAKSVTSLAGVTDYYLVNPTPIRFNLSGSIDSDLPGDSFSISDGNWSFYDGASTTTGSGMPESFVPEQVKPGTWTTDLTATIEGSNDNFATVTTIAAGVASGASTITLGTAFRSIRWVWGKGVNSVPVDFAATGLQIIGHAGDPGALSTAFGRYTNTSTMTAVRGGSTITKNASAQYVLETPQPHPYITKSVSNGTRQPGQNATYTLRVTNNVDATGDLVNPYIEDCVPAHFTVQGTPTLGSGWTAGSPLPSCDPGATPLRFDYTGTLTPGQQTATVTYVVTVDAAGAANGITPPGTYINTATVRPDGGGSFGHCQNTNPACGAKATVVVPAVIDLQSSKCVRGDLDGGIFRPSPACQTDPAGAVTAAQTRPGGNVEWQLRLTNQGNTDATNVDFIDIMPQVGDTAVITGVGGNLNARNSEFEIFMVSLVSAPPGWTISYSTRSNPCRGEVGGVNNAGVNCEAPNWVTNPQLTAMPAYRSVKFSYAGIVPMGSSATFTWETRTPVQDPTYDQGGVSASDPYEFLGTCSPTASRTNPTHCPRAVNSFAYGADAANLPGGVAAPSRLTSEPPQAEVRVSQHPTALAIGDRVWFDRNYDGLQAADRSPSGEPGVASVYVELYQCTSPACTASSLVSSTFTDGNGNYLFGADDGIYSGITYQVRFYPPSGHIVTLANQPGPEGVAGDSDVSSTPTGVDSYGPYHVTPPITASNATPTDLTWDMGLWKPEPAVTVDKVTKDSAWPDNQAGDGVSVLRNRAVTWIYSITNTGNTRLQNVTVGDDGGVGGTPFSVTDCSITADGTNASGLHSSAVAPIALNRGATMRCTATGTAGSSDYTNTATVAGTPKLDNGTTISFGSPPATVSDSDTSSYLSGTYDLSIAVAHGTFDCAAGQAPYTITVHNNGTVASGAYRVVDTLGAATSLAGLPSPAPTTFSANSATWDMPSLAAGATATITFSARVDDYSAGPFTNQATITANGAAAVVTGGVNTPTTDVDSSNNTAQGNLTVGQQAYGLALTKTVDAANIAFDANATFHVNVVNKGNVVSGTYTVVDTVPAGMTFVSASDGGVLATAGDGSATVTWTLSGLASGAQRSLSVVLHPSDLTKRPYRNAAAITADGSSSLVGSHCPLSNVDAPQTGAASVDVPVIYDLELLKLVVPGQKYMKGGVVDYTIEVRNEGNVPSGLFSVHDVMPAGMSFATASDGGVSDGAIVTWTDLPSLAPGAMMTLKVGLRLDDVARASYRNIAEITADSANTYSTPTITVVDVDSTPGAIHDSSSVVERHSFSDPLPPDQQDSRDVAALDVRQVLTDNHVPLPQTGGDTWALLRWALAFVLVGGGMVMLSVRRRLVTRR